MIRILLIDDEAKILKYLQMFLEDEGFEVSVAATAEEAIELMDNCSFHVAIVDMRMPGMDGNSLIMKLHEYCGKIRFIIHTGSSNYALPLPLREIGIKEEDVFTKPVTDMDQLTSHIRLLAEE